MQADNESESDVIRLDTISEDDIASLSDDVLEKLQNEHVDDESDTGEDSDDLEETDDVVKIKKEGAEQDKPKNQMSPEERIQALEKQIENLEKIKNDRGEFIEKQNSVITTLKSKVDNLAQRRQELEKKTSDQNYWESPKEAFKAENEKAQVEQQLASATSELRYRENKSAIEQVVPNYNEIVDDIITYLKEEVDPEGTTDEAVALFKKDPFVISAQQAIDWAKGANVHKRMKLIEEKAGILKNKPRAILNKINQAANYKTATSSPSGTSESDISDISDVDISKMSDADLQNFIKSAEKKVSY